MGSCVRQYSSRQQVRNQRCMLSWSEAVSNLRISTCRREHDCHLDKADRQLHSSSRACAVHVTTRERALFEWLSVPSREMECNMQRHAGERDMHCYWRGCLLEGRKHHCQVCQGCKRRWNLDRREGRVRRGRQVWPMQVCTGGCADAKGIDVSFRGVDRAVRRDSGERNVRCGGRCLLGWRHHQRKVRQGCKRRWSVDRRPGILQCACIWLLWHNTHAIRCCWLDHQRGPLGHVGLACCLQPNSTGSDLQCCCLWCRLHWHTVCCLPGRWAVGPAERHLHCWDKRHLQRRTTHHADS